MRRRRLCDVQRRGPSRRGDSGIRRSAGTGARSHRQGRGMGGRERARRRRAQRSGTGARGNRYHAARRCTGGEPMTTNDNESTGFLYPFIESEETDAGSLLEDLAASARGKAAESARLQKESLEEYGPGLTEAGTAMA